MPINRDVVTDLLPLYLAGEASAGTRALLEQYLREHPEFAAEIRGHAEKSAALLGAAIPPLPPDHEKATFDRVRRVNRYASVAAGVRARRNAAAVLVCVHGRDQLDLAARQPAASRLLALAAVVCWTAYAVMGRRLRAAPGR